MTFTGTDVDLDRLPGCVFGVTSDPPSSRRRGAGRRARWTLAADRRGQPRALPRGARARRQPPGHPGRAGDGLLRAAGAADPAGTLRPLLTAALDNALDYGDAALTGPIVPRRRRDRAPPTCRRSAADGRTRCRPYVAMARATADRARRRRPARARSAPPRWSTCSTTRWPARGCRRPRWRRPVTRAAAAERGRRARARAAQSSRGPASRRAGRPRADHGRAARRARLADPRRAPRRSRRDRWSRSSSTRCSSARARTSTATRAPSTPTWRSARADGVDVVFAPAVDEVYPGGEPQVTVEPGPLGGRSSRAPAGPATSAACSPWSPSCSAWSAPTWRCSARRTTSSSC